MAMITDHPFKFCLAMFWLAALPAAFAASLLDVKPAPDGSGVQVRINPSKASSIALLEVLDGTSNRCLRTVFAGPVSAGQTVTVGKQNQLPPGNYRLRYREGICLEYDSKLVPRTGEKWINPTDLQITDQGIYVLDSGIIPPEKKPAPGEAAPAPGEEEEIPGNRSAIFKFGLDGKPSTFGNMSCIEPYKKAISARAIAVDEGGQVYLSWGHDVAIFSSIGKPLSRRLGGWNNDPLGPTGTGYTSSVTMAPDRRIYIPTAYGHLKVFDRTKSGLEGALGKVPYTLDPSMERFMAADPQQRVAYLLYKDERLQRFDDNGKLLEPKYFSPSGLKIAHPTGPSVSANLIWVCAHGPGYGPFWDSGGGGEILLFWDSGKEILLVDRYGTFGAGKDEQLIFMNPSAVAMTADHLAVWVAEDGSINEEGPHGGARIRKFRVASEQTEEASFEISGAKPSR
jgi:hypothetical protein